MDTAGADAPRISPLSRISARVMERAVRLYQLTFAALAPGQCRFEPSCSAYAREALCAHGALRGVLLTVRRLLRCSPWGGAGFDPVPSAETTHGRG